MLFFFSDTASTEIYTLSLHDALPICPAQRERPRVVRPQKLDVVPGQAVVHAGRRYRTPALRGDLRLRVLRSEEHTSELQSLAYLVCRLLLEKKNVKSISQPLHPPFQS